MSGADVGWWGEQAGPLTLAQNDAGLYLALLADAAGVLAGSAKVQGGEALSNLVSALAWIDDPEGTLSLEAATIPVTFGEVCGALRLDAEECRRDFRRQFRHWMEHGTGRKPWSWLTMTTLGKGAEA